MNDRSSSLSITDDIVHSVEGLNLMGYNEKSKIESPTAETLTSKALLDPDTPISKALLDPETSTSKAPLDPNNGAKKKFKTKSMEEGRMTTITKNYKEDASEKKDDEDERKPIGSALRKESRICFLI